MARSELIREFEKLMEKVKVQKNLLVDKIDSVDHKKAAVDDSLYELFMPTVEVFQDELGTMMGAISAEIQNMGDKIIAMIDAIDEEAEKLPPEEEDEGGGNDEDVELSSEEVEMFEKDDKEDVTKKESNEE
jgi:hypothetical protein